MSQALNARIVIKQLFDCLCQSRATIMIYHCKNLRIDFGYVSLRQLSVTVDLVYNVYV